MIAIAVNIFNKENCENFIQSLSEVTNSDKDAQRAVIGYTLKQYYKPVPWIPQEAKIALYVLALLLGVNFLYNLSRLCVMEIQDVKMPDPSVDTHPVVPPAYPLPTEAHEAGFNTNQEVTMKDVMLKYYGYYLNIDRAFRSWVVKAVEWLKGI